MRRSDGSVSIVSALTMPFIIAMVALVAEYGYGLLTKVQDQRVADLAAYAGALAYNASASTTTMNSVVTKVGAMNGVSTADIAAAIVNSPTGDGNQAVQVTVSTNAPLQLAQVLGGSSTLPVSASSYAELKANAQGCIIALNTGGTGVTLSGGTAVQAPGCAVASNATVSVPCGTTMTTLAVNYDSASPPSEPCTGITAPSGKTLKIIKAVTADPLAGNSGVTSATSRISSVSALGSPGAPTAPGGGDISFAYSTAATQAQASADGCSATFSGSTWTLTCTGNGPFHFGNITTGGGINVNFNTGGSTSAVYDFSGSINMTGTNLAFGPGTYNIAQGIITGGGTTTSFAAGTFNIGASSASCNGTTGYSICNTATLTFGGPSVFVFSGGIYNGGGEKITFGSGSNNSFDVGKASNGDSFDAGGGSTTVFGDATGASDLFEMAGNFNVVSGGGSCVTVSAAAEHDINGYFATAGGTTLGSGIYTVNGYIGLGTNGGGDVTCNGATVGLTGTGVTFVTSGASTISGGTCSGQVFCVAAGYSHVTLTAPSTGTTADLVVIGPTLSSDTAGATFAEGATSTSLSGAFYFPHGPVTLSGGASVGNGTGQCLELIGSQVTLTGGTALASTCISSGAASASVVLVQ